MHVGVEIMQEKWRTPSHSSKNTFTTPAMHCTHHIPRKKEASVGNLAIGQYGTLLPAFLKDEGHFKWVEISAQWKP
jgi:hypothetical protein